MDKGALVLVIAGILLVVVALQAFQLSGLVKTAKAAQAGQVQAAAPSPAASQALDTSGWTANEKMNYEMHGIIPSRVQGQSGASQAGAPSQVGGC